MFMWPSEVVKRIERLQQDFLLQGREDKHKYHLVSWSFVCKSKNDGGPGFRPITPNNQALPGKWM